jgi:hypothetical protein
MRSLSWSLFALFGCDSVLLADNGPAWRGPTGQGLCGETNLPLRWSRTENVRKLYVTDQKGTTLVLAAGPKYEVLAVNPLGEHTNASIAISDGDLFIRTWKHLWCIGNQRYKGVHP